MVLGIGVKLWGKSEFNSDLLNVIDKIKQYKSEMKLMTAQQSGHANSIDSQLAKVNKLSTILEAQKEVCTLLRERYSKLSQEQQANKTIHQELVSKYTDAKTKLENIGSTLGTTSSAYVEQAKAVDKLSKQVQISEKNYNSNERELGRCKLQLTNYEAACVKTEKSISNLNHKMGISETVEKSVNSENQKLSRSLDSVHTSAQRAGEGFTVFKGAVASFVGNIATMATQKISEIAKESLEVGMNFEAAMSQVKAISGATGADFDQLGAKAKELGATTQHTASDVAAGMNYMAMAGWEPKAMLGSIGDVLNLTSASGLNLARVSDIVTDAMTAMGYTFEDTGKFADVLAQTAANANTNVDLMGTTFQYVAPLAGSAKYSIEDVALAIGLMANAGIKGEKAGTALRGILTRLISPTDDSEAAMKRLGITMQNSDGTMKPLKEILDKLRTSMNKLTDAEKAEVATSLAGKNAISGLLAIVNAAPADYTNLATAIKKSEGAAKKMADTMIANGKGGVTLLKSNIEGLQIALYEKLKPAFNEAIKGANGLVDMCRGLIGYSTPIIGSITSIGTALITYLVSAKIINGIKSLTTSIVSLSNPVGLALSSISLLAGGIATITAMEAEHQNSLKTVSEEIQQQTDKVNKATEAWDNLSKQRQDTVNAQMTEIAHYQNLYTELMQIVDANGKVKQGYEDRAKFISTELSKALGIEIQDTNNVIQNYQTLQGQIDKLIKQKRAKIILDSQEPQYNEALKQQMETIKQLLPIEGKLPEARRKQAEAEKELEQAIQRQNELRATSSELEGLKAAEAVARARDKVTRAKNETKELEKNYNDRKELIRNYAFTIGQYESNLEQFHAGHYDKMQNLDWQYVKNYQKTGEAQTAALADQKTTTEAHLKELKELKEKSGSDIYDSQIQADEKLLKQIKEDYTKYVSATSIVGDKVLYTWNDNLAKTLSIVTGRKIQFVEAGNGNIQAYVNGIGAGSAKPAAEMEKIVNSALFKIFVKRSAFQKSGEDFLDGFNLGIANRDKHNKAFNIMHHFGTDLLTKFRQSLREKSPSKATKEMGENLTEGLIIGINSKRQSALKTIGNLGTNVLGSLNNKLDMDVLRGMQYQFKPDFAKVSSPKVYSNSYNSLSNTTNNETPKADRGLVEAFKTALKEVKIEMNDENMGKFVENTVTNLVYT